MEKVAGLPRGEASARATLRGAVVLLTAHLLGRGAARGGGGSRDSSSRNFLTDRPIPIGYPKNCSAQQLLAARLGDSFYFAKSEIVESLLRHGARCRSALEPGCVYPNKGSRRDATRRPAGPRLRRGGAPIGRFIGHSGEKTFFVRSLAEIDQTTESCLVNFPLQHSRAGAARHAKQAVSTRIKAGRRDANASAGRAAY